MAAPPAGQGRRQRVGLRPICIPRHGKLKNVRDPPTVGLPGPARIFTGLKPRHARGNCASLLISSPFPATGSSSALAEAASEKFGKPKSPGGMLKAIKFVYGDLDEATEDGKPAEQELKSLHRVKSIRHPYILSLERFEVVEGQLLIVMELADRNLFDRYRECQQEGLPGIPRDELLDYMEESSERSI